MSVWKNRKTYRWRVQRNGVVLEGSARTREEAVLLEARAVQQLASGVTGTPIRRTLSEAFARYLDSPELAALKSREDILDNKLPPWYSHIEGRLISDVVEVADEAVAEWLRTPSASTGKLVAVATINRRLAVLRRILKLAHIKWDWTDRDYAAKIQLLPGEVQRQVWLSYPESVRLRRACRPRQLRAAVTLLLCTGMRVGELLKVRPWNIINGAIHLDARTKTGKPRAVPVLKPGLAYLHHIPIPYTYDGLRSAFDTVKRRIGLDHVHLHDLRHTLGSQLAESGASLRDIQVWLGHTNPATTTRYTHIELSRLQAVARNLLSHREDRKPKQLIKNDISK